MLTGGGTTTAIPVFVGFQQIVLPANRIAVTGTSNGIAWIPDKSVVTYLTFLLNQVNELKLDIRLLIWLTLKDNFIWSAKDPNLFLDGEAFGLPGWQSPTNLSLPSGDGRKGGDFEMWFWAMRPIRIRALQLNPNQFSNAGGTGTGTITLDSVAPTGGLVINLSSSNPNVAVVGAANVTVKPGETQAQFAFNVLPNLANGATCQINAVISGIIASAPLTVTFIS